MTDMTRPFDAFRFPEYKPSPALDVGLPPKGASFVLRTRHMSDGLSIQKDTNDRQIGPSLGLDPPGKGCSFYRGKAMTTSHLQRCARLQRSEIYFRK
jgi:hypothetical protein